MSVFERAHIIGAIPTHERVIALGLERGHHNLLQVHQKLCQYLRFQTGAWVVLDQSKFVVLAHFFDHIKYDLARSELLWLDPRY